MDEQAGKIKKKGSRGSLISTNLRLSKELLAKLDAWAKWEKRSRQAHTTWILEQALSQWQNPGEQF